MADFVPTYDIETQSWSDVVAVGFFDGTEYHEFIQEDEHDDPLWRFLKYLSTNHPGIKVYAHYGAEFDAKFVLAKLQQKNQLVRLEAALMRLVWDGPDITFEDSFAVTNLSLEKLAEAMNVERKLDWDHNQTIDPWRMRPSDFERFKAYLKRDCISLSKALTIFCFKLLQEFNVTPSLTLALTAVKAFDKGYHKVRDIASNEQFEEQIRHAVYGGRAEVYRRYGENFNVFDVRSQYVSCYDVPVPVERMCWAKPNLDKATIAEAVVKVPKDFFVGPLPFRYRGRLVFPVGELKGWWDGSELRFATELGCDLKILRQLQGDEANILQGFGIDIMNLRASANADEQRIWKLMGVRLCGKFGQGRWRSRIVSTDSLKDFTGSIPIDKEENFHEVMEYVTGKKGPYIKPAINMRIRAEARIRHTRQLLDAHRQGQIYYCDTDSIICDADLETGPDIGELQKLNHAERGYFVQPKFYGYVVTTYGRKTVLVQRSAGFRDFRLQESDFKQLLDGKEVKTQQFDGLTNWKEVLAGDGVQIRERQRTVGGPPHGSRVVEGHDTRPYIVIDGRLRRP